MKFIYLIVILLLTASVVQAQTAKVIVLNSNDAEKAKSLYAQKTAIEKQIDEFTKTVTNTYLMNGKDVKDGWANGFMFSEDFKSIVPNSFIIGNYISNCSYPSFCNTLYYCNPNNTLYYCSPYFISGTTGLQAGQQ